MFLSVAKDPNPPPKRYVSSPGEMTEQSVVLSSADITDTDEKEEWEYGDTPPTILRVTLPSWPTTKSIGQSNTRIKVYLRRYFFDCVWRDSSNPQTTITSNSGTSVSKKIMIWIFVGAQGTTRLLKPVTAQTATADPDIIITRNQSSIGEWGSNPYSTEIANSTDNYFENQYCNMTEFFGQPGLYIGDVNPQAMSALRDHTIVTLKIVNDRTDFPSPFWYGRFLKGVSLWDKDKLQYDVVEAGTTKITYYKKLNSLTVQTPGGPYMPTGLFLLTKPFIYQLHTHISLATIEDVDDPLEGEFVVSNIEGVEFFIFQAGLLSSSNLQDFNRSKFSTQKAPSDERNFTVRVYNPATTVVNNWEMANDKGEGTPSVRFLPYEPFYFPNGEWRGNSVCASKTSSGTYSCFSFEQSLTSNQISMLDDLTTYSKLPTSAKYEVLPNHLFYFMDGGSSWLEEEFPGTTEYCTIGERSIQFDLTKERFVNKMQLIFPRSQEDYQPTKMAASLQRFYDTDYYTDTNEAVWFGNYQHDSPNGNYESASTSKDYLYINTHTQSENTLYGGSTTLMTIDTTTSPSKKPFSGTTDGPSYTGTTKSGRSHFVQMNSSDSSYVQSGPNSVNPGFDFSRQEYGPFVRGCTINDFWDTTKVKAVTIKGNNADWRGTQYNAGHYFTSITSFWFSTQILSLTKAYTYVLKDGSLHKLSNTAENEELLLDTDIEKYQYPTDYKETSPNPLFQLSTFSNIAKFMFDNFTIYLTSSSPSSINLTDSPLTDYIVKETYYFSPHYYQYSSVKASATGPYRPSATELSQKMIRPELAQGRFFGLTFGSFLNDAGNPTPHRYTRGLGNQMRLYSIRLCTQLFSFTTNLGSLTDVADSPDSKAATFKKVYKCGILDSCTLDYTGEKFTNMEYSTTENIHLYPEFSDQSSSDTTFIHPTSGQVLDRGEYLLTNNLDALQYAATNLKMSTVTETEPSRLIANMEDDKTLSEYIYYVKASQKTPLRRFAELQLDLVTS